MQNFVTDDIKNFYLNTPMNRPEYTIIPVKHIPQEIIDEYNLLPLVNNGFVYIEITERMHGLPKAGLLANELLTKLLAKYVKKKLNTPQDYCNPKSDQSNVF